MVDSVEEGEQLLRHIGSAAAYYLETTLRPGDLIGISSWSATLLAMVDALHPPPRISNVRVLQILGGLGNPSAKVYASRLIDRLASLVRGEAVLLPAPGVVSSPDAVSILRSDPYVRQAIDLFGEVTIALVGIGTVEPSGLLASSGNIYSPAELAMLQSAGAVGDVCLHFFDGEGKPVETPLDERVIGMSLEQLRHAKRTVGIAGGKRKLAAIRGALLGKWINVLITDRATAEGLLVE